MDGCLHIRGQVLHTEQPDCRAEDDHDAHAQVGNRAKGAEHRSDAALTRQLIRAWIRSRRCSVMGCTPVFEFKWPALRNSKR